MLKLIYIFGHVLNVNNRCYGRCYVKKLIPLCTFLACTQAVGWRVEKTGIRDEVAILNSRGQVWAGWRVDKVSEGRGRGEG